MRTVIRDAMTRTGEIREACGRLIRVRQMSAYTSVGAMRSCEGAIDPVALDVYYASSTHVDPIITRAKDTVSTSTDPDDRIRQLSAMPLSAGHWHAS